MSAIFLQGPSVPSLDCDIAFFIFSSLVFTASSNVSCRSFPSNSLNSASIAGYSFTDRYAEKGEPWWKALTEGFTRCRFHVTTTDRKLEEVLAWFSQAMGPMMAALYCAAGPEWVAKVIESGSHRWKPHHYQLMKKQKPKRPYPLSLENSVRRTERRGLLVDPVPISPLGSIRPPCVNDSAEDDMPNL